MKPFKLGGACALAVLFTASLASAQTVLPSPGWVYSSQTISDLTQSCVRSAPGGTFVGSGPGFTGNGQEVLFVTEAGGERVVMSGLNSIGDCVYDASTDTLYVTDNALEAAGSVTGDTVYSVPSASTASGLVASAHELLPSGSISTASSIAIDSAGDLYVTDSAGNGVGSIRKISGGVMSTLVSGLDFAGGVVVDSSGVLYVAESLASFENQITSYDSAGVFQGVVSGPTFAHGSYGLVFDDAGALIVTGLFAGDVVTVDPSDGSIAPFASGFTFATGVERNPFNGRVQLLSSTFIPDDEDLRIHKLVPVDELVAGKGGKKSECLSEFFGLELVSAKPGKKAKKAICVDGEACDSDGLVNDVCTYPIGFCLNVDDARYADCSATQLAQFELKKIKPESAAIATAVATIAESLPLVGSTCVFSDGMQVPVKIKTNGTKKKGVGKVKVRAARTDSKPTNDVDLAKLECLPAAP